MKHKLIDPSRACFLTEVAEKVYGVDPLDTSRTRAAVFARTAISTQMIESGENDNSIAYFFKKDRGSIYHVLKNHPNWMEYDKQYNALYTEFLKEIGMPINKKEFVLEEIRGQVKGINKTLESMEYNTDEIMNFWNEILKGNYANAV